MTPEKLVCEGCLRVNPGGLRESNGKVLCTGCRAKAKINKQKYELLCRNMEEHGITRPNLRQIMIVVDVDVQQAANYRRAFKADHPENYQNSTKK
jgi:hypothetical protein